MQEIKTNSTPSGAGVRGTQAPRAQIVEILAREFGATHKTVTRALLDAVKNLQKIINPQTLGEDFRFNPWKEDVPSICWRDGMVYRCKHYWWAIYDGELVIAKNVDYSGMGTWFDDPESTIQGLAEHKHYNVIKELALDLVWFVRKLTEELKRKNDEAKSIIKKLNKITEVSE